MQNSSRIFEHKKHRSCIPTWSSGFGNIEQYLYEQKHITTFKVTYGTKEQLWKKFAIKKVYSLQYFMILQDIWFVTRVLFIVIKSTQTKPVLRHV